jgi:hypothetical protein
MKLMFVEFIRRNLFWFFLTLISLLVWILRWIPESFVRFYNIVFISWDYYPRVLVRGSMYTIATLGMVSRLLVVILGFYLLFIIWKKKAKLYSLRKKLAICIGLEGLYYASLIPSILYLFALMFSLNSVFYGILGTGYLFHVVLTFPFLTVLAIKVFKSGREREEFHSQKLLGVTFFGYIVALWANASFRWIGLVITQGLEILWNESNIVLALNSIILMTIGIIFGFFGAIFLSKKQRKALKYIGLSLASVGLHYLIYLIYHIIIEDFISIWLIDLWAIAFIGIGISLVRQKIST